MKYGVWLQEWLEYYVKPVSKARTLEKYGKQIKNHIAPLLGNYEMNALSAAVLQKFTVKLTERDLSANTVNAILSTLKSSLKRAVALNIAESEYSDQIVRPRVREKKVECFSKNEQRKIENYVIKSKRDKLFGIVLCLYAGLRIGELLALEWSDIDFQKCVLTVEKSCHDSWKNGSYVKIIDTPKTDNSVRVIPLPKQLMPRLRKIYKNSTCKYVVGGKTSVFGAEVRSYQRTFGLLLKKLQIPHKGFHSLRHTFATRALECGMDVRTLSEILGHKNPAITLKRYAHSMLEHKTEMMNRIGRLFLLTAE